MNSFRLLQQPAQTHRLQPVVVSYKGFGEIIRKFRYPISQEIVEKSFQMLKEFNPRIHYGKVEYYMIDFIVNIVAEVINFYTDKVIDKFAKRYK